MPIHFNDRDVVSKVSGLNSALIVPCIMCPSATLAIREKKPFMQFFKSLFKSAPLEQYIKSMQLQLGENGVETKVFKSRIYHQWFLCMWTSKRRRKLQKYAEQHEAVVVLGCDSATETVRDAVKSTDCKVVEGMQAAGLTNAKLRFRFPGSVCFEDVRIVPLPGENRR
jgi:hypothetical protein